MKSKAIKKLTYCDVIEIVSKKFNSENRSVILKKDDDDECLYSITMLPPTEDDLCCAVGMFIDSAKAPKSVWNFSSDAISLFDKFGFDKIMKDEVLHLDSPNFWLALQRLHDKAYNWNENGLTLTGLGYKTLMLEKWGNK